GKVEVGLSGVPGPGFNSGLPEDLGQLVLSVGVPSEAMLDKSWVDCERLRLGRQRAYLGLSVCGAERWCRDPALMVCAGGGELGRCAELREELDKLHRQLVEVGLLGAGFGAAVEAEGKVQAPGMV